MTRSHPHSARRRYANDAPGFLHRHRGLVRPASGPGALVEAALLALGLTAAWLYGFRWIGRGWAHLFAFWKEQLDLPGQVVLVMHRWIDGFVFPVPYLNLPAGAPDAATWWITLVATLLLFAGSFALPARFTPFVYFLRAVAFIQGTALAYFGLSPVTFPYTLPDYVHGMMLTGFVVLSLVPLVLGFTYYVQDTYRLQKLGLTLAVLLHLSVFVPLQYLLHASLLHTFSMLFMPLLYLLFGLPLDVLVFVALYAWGMSWEGRLVPTTTPIVPAGATEASRTVDLPRAA